VLHGTYRDKKVVGVFVLDFFSCAASPVSLSSQLNITVTLGFTNVSTANGDYTTTPVVVTFLAGATTATATVATTEDPIAESAETFTVGILHHGNSRVPQPTATGTITDNDNAPTVTIGDAIIAERRYLEVSQ
jgi:hypothetical protein